MIAAIKLIGLVAWRIVEMVVPMVGALARHAQVTRAQVQIERIEAQNEWLSEELRRVSREAVELRRRLRIAIADRDKWHRAWQRARDHEPAVELEPPVPLDWRSPYGRADNEEG